MNARWIADLRYGVRFVQRNLGFTVVCVLLLALGIGLSVTMFALVQGALLRPWPYQGYDRLVTLRGNYPQHGRTDFSLWSSREIDDLRQEVRSLAHVIAGDARNVNVMYEGHPERVRAAVITPNAFAMLGVAPFRGRVLIEQDARPGAPPTVLVSHRFWEQRLGASATAVGGTLRIGDVPYTIVGVMPASFVFWDRELWMPLALEQGLAREDRRWYVQAQLSGGSTTRDAETELAAIARRWQLAYPEVAEYRGLTFGVNLLVEDVLRDLRSTLYVLLGAVLLVLVVATMNLANAMLARGLARDGELAVRRAIGATGTALVRQLLTESAIVSVAGAILGTAAATYALPFVVALVPYGYIPAEAAVEIDGTVLGGAILMAAGCGLLIGVMPAVRAARVDPAAVLKSGSTRTGSRKTHHLRVAFVGAQLTLAVIVLGLSMGAVLGLQSIVHRYPGFDVDEVWTARVALPDTRVTPADRARTYRQLLETIERGVAPSARVALASAMPLGDLPRTLVSREAALSAASGVQKDARILTVDSSFFDVLDLRVSEGREFVDADRDTSQPVAIVTRALADELWPGASAVGRRLYLRTGTASEAYAVVGVTGELVAQAASAGTTPTVFLSLNQSPPATAVIAIKGGGGNLMAAVTAAAASVDPRIPIHGAEMLAQARVATVGPQLLAATVLAAFGVSVLLVSALGIYSVMSQSVAERTHETRLRFIFGARPRQLVAAELTRALRIIGVAVVAGVAGGAASLRFLASRVSAFEYDPVTSLGVAAMTVALLAFASTLVPALRITRTL